MEEIINTWTECRDCWNKLVDIIKNSNKKSAALVSYNKKIRAHQSFYLIDPMIIIFQLKNCFQVFIEKIKGTRNLDSIRLIEKILIDFHPCLHNFDEAYIVDQKNQKQGPRKKISSIQETLGIDPKTIIEQEFVDYVLKVGNNKNDEKLLISDEVNNILESIIDIENRNALTQLLKDFYKDYNDILVIGKKIEFHINQISNDLKNQVQTSSFNCDETISNIKESLRATLIIIFFKARMQLEKRIYFSNYKQYIDKSRILKEEFMNMKIKKIFITFSLFVIFAIMGIYFIIIFLEKPANSE